MLRLADNNLQIPDIHLFCPLSYRIAGLKLNHHSVHVYLLLFVKRVAGIAQEGSSYSSVR